YTPGLRGSKRATPGQARCPDLVPSIVFGSVPAGASCCGWCTNLGCPFLSFRESSKRDRSNPISLLLLIRGCAAEAWRSSLGGAVPLRKESDLEHAAPSPNRGEVLARYRTLREISKRHHAGAMKLLSADAILRHARRLGLAQGKTFILDNADELTLAFDLAIYSSPVDRSRAIDRYARSAQFAPGSDEALMLDAMCNARFAVVVVQGRHPSAGLIVTDLFRKT